MSTKYKILEIADNLVSVNGLNAFSYKDISNMVGIKTSSIHYHFPAKTDLILALINRSSKAQHQLISSWNNSPPLLQLEHFLDYYLSLAKEKKMCIILAISSDIIGLDEKIKFELGKFYDSLKVWIMYILEEGLTLGHIKFEGKSEEKASEILHCAAMLPVLSRIGQGFSQIVNYKNSIIHSIIPT